MHRIVVLILSVFRFAVKIIVDFILVPITAADSVGIQNSFKLFQAFFFFMLIVNALNCSSINVVIDRVPRLIQIDFVSFGVRFLFFKIYAILFEEKNVRNCRLSF